MRAFGQAITLSLLVAGLALAAGRLGAEEAPRPTPRVHSNSCSLGDSMARSLLSRAKWTPEQAEKTCKILQPTMSDEDGAEFQRCCVQRLGAKVEASDVAPPTPEPPKRRP